MSKQGAVISLDKVDFSSSIDGDSQLLGNDLPLTDNEGTNPPNDPPTDPPADPPKEEEEEEEEGNGEEEEEEGNGEEGNEGNAGGEEEEEELGSIEDLASELSLALPEGKTYEQNFDGVREFLKDVKPLISEQAAEEFYEQFPLAADYVRAKMSGMSDIEFAKQVAAKEVDYSLEAIPEDNEALQESIVRNNLKAKNYSPERIERQIKRLKDADELYTEAQDAFEEDKNREIEAATKAKADAEKAKADRVKQEKQYLDTQKDLIVKKGKVGNITIPVADREAFFQARHARTESGNTALEEKLRSMTDEERIAFDYYLYKGGKLETVVKNAAKTQHANNLLRKSKASKGSSNMSNGKQKPRITGEVPKNITNFIPKSDI